MIFLVQISIYTTFKSKIKEIKKIPYLPTLKLKNKSETAFFLLGLINRVSMFIILTYNNMINPSVIVYEYMYIKALLQMTMKRPDTIHRYKSLFYIIITQIGFYIYHI